MASSPDIAIAPGIMIPAAMLRFTYARSSGPGGQNVNKLNTKAQLAISWDDLAPLLPDHAARKLASLADSDHQLQFASQEHRSQIANRDECIEKLRAALVKAMHRPRKRKPTKPTRASVRRRIDAKKQRGQIKRRRGPVDLD